MEKSNNNDDNKDHIYTGKLVQQNEFAAINQEPLRVCVIHACVLYSVKYSEFNFESTAVYKICIARFLFYLK